MARPETQFGGEINTFDLPNKVSSAFDVDAFDEAIQAHGIRFVHYRALPNPVGLIDRFDSRRPDADHSGASNNNLYTRAGVFTGLFTGNSKSLRAIEGGVLSAATAQLTPTRNYDCSQEPVYLQELDRLYLEEESILVTHRQLVEASETGKDKLRFPAVQVLDVVDANNIRYKPDVDFQIAEGRICWTGSNRPGANSETGRGRIYAVRFLYRPYWYVDRMLHEIRVAQVENPVTGAREMVRMQQAAVIQREYVFESEKKDEEAPASPRQAPEPLDPGYGFR